MAHRGPEAADSCSCVAETMAEDRPTATISRSVRPVILHGKQRLVCQGAR
jgi:hypothetical protein